MQETFKKKIIALVAIKRVIDYRVNIQVKPDGSGVVTDHVQMSLNPFDEIALEAAQKLKESGIIEETIAVTIGPAQSQETLRVALARGADRGILIQSDPDDLQFQTTDLLPIEIAQILAESVQQTGAGLVLMGKQAIDTDHHQTGQMLAGLLGWSQGTCLSKLEFLPEPHSDWIRVEREVDSGVEILELKLPAVLTTDLRLNQPRYLNIPSILQAKTKPIQIIALSEVLTRLNIQPNTRQKILKIQEKPIRKKGQILNSVPELVNILKSADYI